MKKYFLILFYFFCNYGLAQNNVQKLCDSLASAYLKNQAGSLVIGIYDNGRQLFKFYGETEKNKSILPDSNSIFEIGNITETFTCILYVDATRKGLMHIDDRLQDYLPFNIPSPVYQPLVCRPLNVEKDLHGYSDEDKLRIQFSPYMCVPDSSFDPQPVLLCYLASHTSGFPELPGNFRKKNKSNPYAAYSKEDMYNFLKAYRIIKPIGFEYNYSETGIALLGLAVTQKMEKDYENLLIENFLDTIGMNDTRIKLTESQEKRLLTGYTRKGTLATHWTYDVFAPVGGLHSTGSDMMKFLSTNISNTKNYYSDLLDFTHNSRLKPGGVLNDDLEIGLGWKIIPLSLESKRIVWQSGQTGGFASYIGFVETSHTGVFILSSVSKNVNEIGIQLLRLLEKETIVK